MILRHRAFRAAVRENTYRYSAAIFINEAKHMVYCSYLQQGTLSMFLHFLHIQLFSSVSWRKPFNFGLIVSFTVILMKFRTIILTQVWVRQKYNFVSFRRDRLLKTITNMIIIYSGFCNKIKWLDTV